MRVLLAICVIVGAGLAHAETPASPYRMTWLFPDEPISAIDIDRGDLSVSRFADDYALAQFLGKLKPGKAKPRKPGEEVVPMRELRVSLVASDGMLRSTAHYLAPLAEWRIRLGADMVERLEDEFDAHLRMLLPRKVPSRNADGGAETP